MEALIAEFNQMVAKGGPAPSDYDQVQQFMNTFADLAKKKNLPKNSLPELWNTFGEVFSVKTLQGHVCQKPYGYAGDFEIIDKIYQSRTSSDPFLRNWDKFFHTLKAPQAVRNRKGYFKSLLSTLEREVKGRDLNVLNIGSGPARDLYEYCVENPGTRINFDNVDQDEKAIKFAKALCSDYLNRITFHKRNALRFKPQKEYDLIWSAGLFDYMNDRLFKFLINRYKRFLKNGGVLVIGNFSTRNPSRGCMEFGQWHLIHRSEKHLMSLALGCGIDKSKISIACEPEGINLFLHIKND